MKKEILCAIPTKGRYDVSLHMTMMAVLMQTHLPDKIIIFDDNDEPEDLRNREVYKALFQMAEQKGVLWEVIFSPKKGLHWSYQIANKMDYEFVWRVDDDTCPEPGVLRNLWSTITHADNIGAVGGSILTPRWYDELAAKADKRSNMIGDIYDSLNKQWFPIEEMASVDHLHCSFLFRAGICDYNTKLSKVGHREETSFTYSLKMRGYDVLLVPNSTSWHLKLESGGIRSNDNYRESLFDHDEEIFAKFLKYGFLIVMDNGLGDHIVLSKLLPELMEKYPKMTIAACYPEAFEGFGLQNIISIAEADTFTERDNYNVYKKMAEWNWTGSLEDAFRRMYL